jgi:hypothetical protein
VYGGSLSVAAIRFVVKIKYQLHYFILWPEKKHNSGKVIGWTTENLRFNFRQRLQNFLSSKIPRPALTPTKSPVRILLESLPKQTKQPGGEDSYSTPPCSEIYLHSPIHLGGIVMHYAFINYVFLVKDMLQNEPAV